MNHHLGVPSQQSYTSHTIVLISIEHTGIHSTYQSSICHKWWGKGKRKKKKYIKELTQKSPYLVPYVADDRTNQFTEYNLH